MDLLNLLRLFLRHKVVVFFMTLAFGGLLVAAYLTSPPVYRASGSVVLLNPPTPDQVPPPRGSTLSTQNPYARLNDLSVVVDIVARVIRSPEVTDELRAKGVKGTFAVAANVDFARGPIVDVSAEAGTPDDARGAARIVMAEFGVQLANIQQQQGTDPTYFIRQSVVVEPGRATTVFSSALRRLIAVAGLGIMAVIGSALLADVVSVGRAERRQRPGNRGGTPGRGANNEGRLTRRALKREVGTSPGDAVGASGEAEWSTTTEGNPAIGSI